MNAPVTHPVPSLDAAFPAARDARGAFESFVALNGRMITDRNGFITALVVRTLGHGKLPPPLHEARERALDCLERCERRSVPGSFGFWPEDTRPSWAPTVPGDADDTAIIALELHRAGRRPPEWLRRVALTVLLPFRVQRDEEEGEPAWVRSGVFRTWLVHRLPNPVDCIVNVNVAALLASAGLAHIAAYRAVVDMVAEALAWTGDVPARVTEIAPFYAHPLELRWALAHAVAAGAGELAPSLERVASWSPQEDACDPDQPVCCSAYGGVTWRSPVLQHVRRGRDRLRRVTD